MRKSREPKLDMTAFMISGRLRLGDDNLSKWIRSKDR